MVFKYNWFDISAKANFETYLSGLKGKPDLRFIEIGPFEGKATIWMLENILTAPTSKIVCIDTFEGSDEHKAMGMDTSGLYQTFMDNTQQYRDKITLIKGTSQDGLKLLIADKYDFVYVDGSHRSPDVLEDAVLSFRLLKHGGIMIFDDYEWKYNNDPIESPKMAIDAFLLIFAKEYRLLLKSYQVVLQKL
jgi:predicted O-methyltransferase YrrM